MKKLILSLLVLFPLTAFAHEMTPAHPQLKPSFVEGLYVTTLSMFNKRNDVEYYELGVFDKDFEPIPFVTSYNVIRIPYLNKVTFDVYLRKQDKDRAVYVCSRSKIRKEDLTRTAISSKICSKFK